MATPENSFIVGVHGYLPEDVYKMKNHNAYTGGVPDVWYSGAKRDLWVEYKFVALPKRGETLIVPNLSALQHSWLSERRSEGRNVCVIVGCKEGAAVLQEAAQWMTGITAASFRDRMISRRSTADFISGFVNR